MKTLQIVGAIFLLLLGGICGFYIFSDPKGILCGIGAGLIAALGIRNRSSGRDVASDKDRDSRDKKDQSGFAEGERRIETSLDRSEDLLSESDRRLKRLEDLIQSVEDKK